ncbi:hypothetical protein P7C73_g3381, partial [Tremellales sp. Uapishka_1]
MAAPPPTEYYAPGFEPSTLKVPQLRSILLAHGVAFPSTVKKAELVDAFHVHVTPLANAHLSAASSVKASNKGVITVSENGDESAPAVGVKRPRARGKKTSEIILAEEIQVEEEPPVKKARGRSRGSTAGTEDSKKPTRKPRKTASLVEEVDAGTEAEAEEDEAPRSTRGRASLTPSVVPSISSVPSSSRRRSVNPSSSLAPSDILTPAEIAEELTPKAKALSRKRVSEKLLATVDDVKEESEKEEDIVIKVDKPKTPRRSAGEESGFSDFNPFQSGGEGAAAKEKRRRKSSMGIQRTPHQPARLSEGHPSVSTPTSILRRVGPSRENLKTPPPGVREALKSGSSPEDYNRVVQAKMNKISSKDISVEPEVTIESENHHPTSSNALIRRVQEAPVAAKSTIPLGLLFLLLLSTLLNYKSQSASLGYCDPTSETNNVILARNDAYHDARSCIARRAQDTLDPHVTSPSTIECNTKALPLIPILPRPDSCTPCPAHAVCDDGVLIACAPEYILHSSAFSFLSPVFDGLPSVGPKAFPPSCRPDTVKKRMIGGLAQEMEKELAKGRGQVVCAGLGKPDGRKGDGELFGMEESTLRETFTARRDPKFSQAQFDDIFEAALKDLIQHEDVIESIDVRVDMPLTCRARLEFVDQVQRSKSSLSEKQKVAELVAVVLKRLQDQEHLHYTDPVSTPNTFIPPAQLRDLVMPPSGSTTSRSKLWQRVQELVEANANVAVREREVKGEVWKTWEWHGVGERRVTWG